MCVNSVLHGDTSVEDGVNGTQTVFLLNGLIQRVNA
jgi:hypothetical protein